jgi:hypothetical protein
MKLKKPYRVVTDDILNWCESYEGPKFHAMLCDPPYSIGFMGKKWDPEDNVVNRKETWEALKQHLHPGAFCFAFSSTRTLHRMMVAIEDAGFVIHPFMALWNFACLSNDTEILTTTGWKTSKTINPSDWVYEWDHVTSTLEPRKPKRIFKYKYSGPMVNIHNRYTNQLLTPNHQVPHKSKTNPRYEFQDKYVFKQACDLARQNHIKLPMSGVYTRGKEPKRITPDIAYLLGWYFTDAWLHRDAYAICFSQCKPKTRKLLERALEAQRGSGFEVISKNIKLLSKKNPNHNDEHSYYCRGPLASFFRDTYPTREFGYEILSWSLACREALFRGLIDGDGTRQYSGNSVVFWSRKASRLDIFSALATTLGHSTSLDYEKGACYVRMHYDATTIPPRLKTASISDVAYKGTVWCVETKAGAFVARRCGKVFITGNSGFPKATNPSFQMGKHLGVEQKLGKVKPGHEGFVNRKTTGDTRFEAGSKGFDRPWMHDETKRQAYHYEKTFDDSRVTSWQGHRYGLQALKPAFEPVVCFQKPYPKKIKPVVSMLDTGAGALNIDGCRIGTESTVTHNTKHTDASTNGSREGRKLIGHTKNIPGRWPSNLVLCHLPECRCVKLVWQCVEGCPVVELGKQSGDRKVATSASSSRNSKSILRPNQVAYQKQGKLHQDSGTAARYYFQASWDYDTQERIESAVPVKYVTKPSGKEKDAGLPSRNTHVTVKPIRIAEYLAKLLLPPMKYKSRLLVPFCGSGSEMIGARKAGWKKVIGVELLSDHVKIAKARLKYWESHNLDSKKQEGVPTSKIKAKKILHVKKKVRR